MKAVSTSKSDSSLWKSWNSWGKSSSAGGGSSSSSLW
jgi:hypothetical protein